ncbi:hypothetical protein [Runella sp.]|uniref:hypothetical protein n=1 Tax=Runella sp. TaxID=1960881 RepID=UPI003D0F8D6A
MTPLMCLLINLNEDDLLIFKPALEYLNKPTQYISTTGAGEALKLLPQENTIPASYSHHHLHQLFRAARQNRNG